MTIGELDRRIEIYTQTNVANKFGEQIPSDTLFATVWAKYDPAGGSEAVSAKKITATNQAQFTIRYRTGLTENMKIKHNLNWYDILRIEELDRKRYLAILAEKKF